MENEAPDHPEERFKAPTVVSGLLKNFKTLHPNEMIKFDIGRVWQLLHMGDSSTQEWMPMLNEAQGIQASLLGQRDVALENFDLGLSRLGQDEHLARARLLRSKADLYIDEHADYAIELLVEAIAEHDSDIEDHRDHEQAMQKAMTQQRITQSYLDRAVLCSETSDTKDIHQATHDLLEFCGSEDPKITPYEKVRAIEFARKHMNRPENKTLDKSEPKEPKNLIKTAKSLGRKALFPLDIAHSVINKISFSER